MAQEVMVSPLKVRAEAVVYSCARPSASAVAAVLPLISLTATSFRISPASEPRWAALATAFSMAET